MSFLLLNFHRLIPALVCRNAAAVLLAALLLGFPSLVAAASDAGGQETDNGAQGQEAAGDPEESPAETGDGKIVHPSATQVPPRAMTRSELQEAIDETQRQVEDLMHRVGDKKATDAQRARFRELWSSLNELEEQLKEKEATADQQMKTEGRGFVDRWKRLTTAAQDFTNYDVKDGVFRIRLGVRLQVDATVGNQTQGIEDLFGSIESGTNFRRFRIFARGRLFRRFDFDFEWDLGADTGLKDVWLEGVKFTKFFRWRLGHFREPISLSRQTGSNFIGMLERPLPIATFAPGRNWGVMLRHSEAEERLFWAVSVTTGGNENVDNQNTASLSFTGRVSGLPLYRDEGRSMVHVGASYSARSPRGDSIQYQAQPEARFAPFYADTGPLDTSTTKLYGFELATVQGPFWVQTEWLGSEVQTEDYGDLAFDGAYIEAGWFLTGESRFYRSQDAVFGRTAPNRLFKGGNPFTGKGAGGAIEFTGRYSALDLNDGAIRGGRMKNVGVGVNWYLSGTSRVMFNYINSDVDRVGSANIFLLRYQFNPP